MSVSVGKMGVGPQKKPENGILIKDFLDQYLKDWEKKYKNTPDRIIKKREVLIYIAKE